MASLFDFSQSILSFIKEKNFADALKYFKENKSEFTPEQISSNKYIVYEILTALIETNHLEAIFSFIGKYNIILDSKSFSYLLKKVKDKAPVNWLIINRFCDLISVDQLDMECRVVEIERKGVKKMIELASAKENWYAFKTKALFETHNYKECFDLSKKALESFQKFHYLNEVWFARRIALSKKSLGDLDEALNELILVLKRKKEWFIQNEIAEIYKEKGEIDKAFKYAIDAINNSGDIEYKVGLLMLIGDLLKDKNEQELAFKHYSLSKLMRDKEGWNIPLSVTEVLRKFSFQQIQIERLPDLKQELKKYWNSFNSQQSTEKQNPSRKQMGRISKILHNDEKGSDGFIKYGSNKSIYFRVNSTDKIVKNLNVGLVVCFKIFSATENKKERAIQLEINK